MHAGDIARRQPRGPGQGRPAYRPAARPLRQRMADVDDRQAHVVAQPLDVGQDLRLAAGVERRQRLVHQQQPRLRQQRPAERRPAGVSPPDSVRGRRSSSSAPISSSSTTLRERRCRRSAFRRPAKAVEQVVARPDMCGNSRASWKTQPTRRQCGERSMPLSSSKKVSRPRRMCPVIRPQQPGDGSTTVDLPDPDGPNSAVMPSSGPGTPTSRVKAPSRRRIGDVQHQRGIAACQRPTSRRARRPASSESSRPDKGKPDRQRRQPRRRRSRCRATGWRSRWRAAASASRRARWRRR